VLNLEAISSDTNMLWEIWANLSHVSRLTSYVSRITYHVLEVRMGKAICVIGGSSAGLFTARVLAEKGLPVDLFDAGDLMNPVERTLIVTSDFFKLPDPGFRRLVKNHIRSFELISPKRSVTVDLAEPDLVISRAELIQYLRCRALQAGVKINCFCELVSGHRENGALFLRFLEDGKEEGRLYGRVVAADGVNSAVGRIFNGGNAYRRVALLQYPVKLPRDQHQHVTRVWFNCEITPFFLWLIPDSPYTGVAGIIGPSASDARRGLKRFLDSIGLSPEGPPQFGEVPLPPVRPVPVSSWSTPNLAFVGDAAAQVEATTVGGVVTGIKGAVALSKSIVTGKPYRVTVRPLWRELVIHRIVQSLLEQCTSEDYNLLLSTLNRWGVSILRRYPRDRLFQAFLPLALSQPQWVPLAFRLLIRNRSRGIIRCQLLRLTIQDQVFVP